MNQTYICKRCSAVYPHFQGLLGHWLLCHETRR